MRGTLIFCRRRELILFRQSNLSKFTWCQWRLPCPELLVIIEPAKRLLWGIPDAQAIREERRLCAFKADIAGISSKEGRRVCPRDQYQPIGYAAPPDLERIDALTGHKQDTIKRAVTLTK
jgi:hypothetical protein